jgi:hypothetical protein
MVLLQCNVDFQNSCLSLSATPAPGRENDAVPTLSLWLIYKKMQKFLHFDADPVQVSDKKTMRLLVAPRPAPKHY